MARTIFYVEDVDERISTNSLNIISILTYTPEASTTYYIMGSLSMGMSALGTGRNQVYIALVPFETFKAKPKNVADYAAWPYLKVFGSGAQVWSYLIVYWGVVV